MGWPKGKPRGKGPHAGHAGLGRKKGAVNKISKPFVLRMQACLDKKTDQELNDWFTKNMTEAMRIMATLERKKVEVTGADGGPIKTQLELSETLYAKLNEIYEHRRGA